MDKILALDYILELDIKNWKQVITVTTSTFFQGYKIKWCTLNLFQLQLFNLQQCCCSTDGANSVPLKIKSGSFLKLSNLQNHLITYYQVIN